MISNAKKHRAFPKGASPEKGSGKLSAGTPDIWGRPGRLGAGTVPRVGEGEGQGNTLLLPDELGGALAAAGRI